MVLFLLWSFEKRLRVFGSFSSLDSQEDCDDCDSADTGALMAKVIYVKQHAKIIRNITKNYTDFKFNKKIYAKIFLDFSITINN